MLTSPSADTMPERLTGGEVHWRGLAQVPRLAFNPPLWVAQRCEIVLEAPPHNKASFSLLRILIRFQIRKHVPQDVGPSLASRARQLAAHVPAFMIHCIQERGT